MSLTSNVIKEKIESSRIFYRLPSPILKIDGSWQEYSKDILENININEAVDLGGHNPKKIYKTEEQIDESKSKFNIQVLKNIKIRFLR